MDHSAPLTIHNYWTSQTFILTKMTSPFSSSIAIVSSDRGHYSLLNPDHLPSRRRPLQKILNRARRETGSGSHADRPIWFQIPPRHHARNPPPSLSFFPSRFLTVAASFARLKPVPSPSSSTISGSLSSMSSSCPSHLVDATGVRHHAYSRKQKSLGLLCTK